MKLREWRIKEGLPLWRVAKMAGKKNPQSINNFEKRGIKSFRQQELFKKISKNEINDFRGCNKE